jgi:hypothetical protein
MTEEIKVFGFGPAKQNTSESKYTWPENGHMGIKIRKEDTIANRLVMWEEFAILFKDATNHKTIFMRSPPAITNDTNFGETTKMILLTCRFVVGEKHEV